VALKAELTTKPLYHLQRVCSQETVFHTLLGRHHGPQAHIINFTFRENFQPNHYLEDFQCIPAAELSEMRLLLPYGLLVSSWTLAIAAEITSTTSSQSTAQLIEAAYDQDGLYAAQDPLQMGAMLPNGAGDSPRHRQEKAHLMKRMNRKTGDWSTSHPRYRLMEALFGFSKYRERSIAELDRWRGLYKNVGKKQKKVSRLGSLHTVILI
jgi:hypothetical protein